jgi:hypothetical protein
VLDVDLRVIERLEAIGLPSSMWSFFAFRELLDEIFLLNLANLSGIYQSGDED